jgi:hypothetical protein
LGQSSGPTARISIRRPCLTGRSTETIWSPWPGNGPRQQRLLTGPPANSHWIVDEIGVERLLAEDRQDATPPRKRARRGPRMSCGSLGPSILHDGVPSTAPAALRSRGPIAPLRAHSSTTRGRPPMMSFVFAVSRGSFASTSPANTASPSRPSHRADNHRRRAAGRRYRPAAGRTPGTKTCRSK